MERLDLIEREAQRLMDHRVGTLDALKGRAHTLAVFLFGAASAAIAFAVSLLEKPLPRGVLVGVVVLGVAWYLVAAAVVLRCVKPTLLPPVGHEPAAMDTGAHDVSVDQMREGVLRMLQTTQSQFADRSLEVAKWLTFGYIASILIAPSLAALVGFLWGRA